MTLASVAEGLAKSVMKPEDQTSEFSESEIQSIKDTIQDMIRDMHLIEIKQLIRFVPEVSGIYETSSNTFRPLDRVGLLTWSQ